MRNGLLAITVSGVLAGCVGATPDCADSETLDLIDQAIVQEVEKYASSTHRIDFSDVADLYDISNIRVRAYDSSIDSYQCDARVTYVFADREWSVDFEYRVDTDQSSGETLVEYQNKMLNPVAGFAIGF